MSGPIYIAGPMTGIPEYNYPAFHAAEHTLIAAGWTVLNPARRGVVDGWSWADYMRPALRDVLDATGIATLPGWERSKGARLETHVATRLGLPIKTVEQWIEASR